MNIRYPGVYVQEVSNSQYVVAGVATSTAAFVGYFSRGPLNTAVLVSSMREFNAIFGGLDVLSEASYGIMQFFSNGGQSTWVVRVVEGSWSQGSPQQDLSAACATMSIPIVYESPPEDDNDAADKTASVAPPPPAIEVYAANPGVWGNLTGLYADDAFAGATPDKAFFVRCDATTTTPADVANGVVNVVFGFAPEYPGEFITLTIEQLAAQGAG